MTKTNPIQSSFGRGAAYVYKKVNGSFVEIQKIPQSRNTPNPHWFGHAVETNGEFIFVSDPCASNYFNPGNYSKRGEVDVFQLDTTGSYVYTEFLHGWSNNIGSGYTSNIGNGLDYHDGNLFVGANEDWPPGVSWCDDCGSIYNYEYNASSTSWVAKQKFSGNGNLTDIGLGARIAASNDHLISVGFENYSSKMGYFFDVNANGEWQYLNTWDTIGTAGKQNIAQQQSF